MTEKNQLIELIYDDDLVQAGEELYENNAVHHLSHIESNLYVAKVRDGKFYEIEIQSPFAKKQKVSCDCSFYNDNKICKHILAGLLAIRAELKTKKAAQETVNTEKVARKLSTLHITQILEEISHEELVAFVKNYARTDKRFSTQLKVNFARKIDLSDNTDKYKNILNTLVRPHTGEQTKATSSDIKAIIHVFEDFIDQINDCIALGQFREAYNIFYSTFSKLEYIRHYYDYHQDKMTELSKKVHLIIPYFLAEKLPPELRVEILHFLLELASRSYYHFADINTNIIALVTGEYRSKDKNVLIQRINELIQNRAGKELAILFALMFKVNGKFTRSDIELLKPYSHQYVEIADHLLASSEEQLALKMLESIYQPKKYVKDLVNRLVFLYVRFRDEKKLTETAKIAYYLSGDVKYIEVLKRELAPEAYAAFIAQMEMELTTDKADPNLLIRIYKKEENWKGLLHYLFTIGNMELLKQHDTLLYRFERNALVEVYDQLVTDYLDHHIGDIAHQYLEGLKLHLHHQQMDAVFKRIQKVIKEKYDHRPRLAELFS